jgi:hypothetical protein
MHYLAILLLLAFSVDDAWAQGGGFRIVGIPGAGTQFLPESHVSTFGRFHVEKSQLVPHACQSGGYSPFVPGSIIRPTLDILVKNGLLSYVMVGVEEKDNPACPPLAQQWTTFELVMEPNFRVEVFWGARDGKDEKIMQVETIHIQALLQDFGMILAESSQAASSISKGFHIISIPLADNWTQVGDYDVVDANNGDAKIMTFLATAEPDARELLTLDSSLVEMTASSVMQVRVVQHSKEDHHIEAQHEL